MNIRPMVRGDLAVVLDMIAALNATGSAADPRYALADDWRQGMRALILDRWFGTFHPFPPCMVAEVDGAVVGMVQGDIGRPPLIVERPPSVCIGNMWVEPEHRRQGIATALVRAYSAAARQAGFPWVEVHTLARDERAVGFWKAMGFGDWRVILLNDVPAT